METDCTKIVISLCNEVRQMILHKQGEILQQGHSMNRARVTEKLLKEFAKTYFEKLK